MVEVFHKVINAINKEQVKLEHIKKLSINTLTEFKDDSRLDAEDLDVDHVLEQMHTIKEHIIHIPEKELEPVNQAIEHYRNTLNEIDSNINECIALLNNKKLSGGLQSQVKKLVKNLTEKYPDLNLKEEELYVLNTPSKRQFGGRTKTYKRKMQKIQKTRRKQNIIKHNKTKRARI